jgi:hypothetical protein
MKNPWDSPTEKMYEIAEEICEKTGVSFEECIKVLRTHTEILNEYFLKIKEERKMATVVIKHDCNNPVQDKIYGVGKRLMNLKKGEVKAKCTVCGKEVDVKGGGK